MPLLKLWIESDGSSAHLVNEAGAKVASGNVLPVQGAIDLLQTAESGDPIRCDLYFDGKVL